MINLSTNGDVLLRELDEDLKAIGYWNRRWHSGIQWRMLADDYRVKWDKIRRPFIGECHEYNSKNGNRWICFDVPFYPTEYPKMMLCMVSFIYWETAASIGCFFPTYNTNNETGEQEEACIIYTSHFFERFCERLKIPFGSKQMVTEFAGAIAFRPWQDDTDKDGRPIKVFRVPRLGIAKGIQWRGCKNIYEVRTFLADENMYKSDKEKYRELIEKVDKPSFAQESYDKAFYNDLINNNNLMF